jgi:uncharacterized protein
MHCLDLEKKIHQILIYKSLKIFICLQKRKNNKSRRCSRTWFRPLAKIIMAQNNDDVDLIATEYLNNVINEDVALQQGT